MVTCKHCGSAAETKRAGITQKQVIENGQLKTIVEDIRVHYRNTDGIVLTGDTVITCTNCGTVKV